MGSVQQQPHIVLVHGACHGAWCWFKVKPLLEAAGNRVTIFDLAASGIDLRSLDELRTFDDYNQPLIDRLATIPSSEKVILVGHSLGGFNIAFAMEAFPEKIAAGVFMSAMMPDDEHPASYVQEQFYKDYPPEDTDYWMDIVRSTFGNPPIPSYLFGPNFTSDRLYTNCPQQDVDLAKTLLRPISAFPADMSTRQLSKEKFGSVKRVYVMGGKDLAIPIEFQRWLIENAGVDEQREMVDAGHMSMVSNPEEVTKVLTEIAVKYTPA